MSGDFFDGLEHSFLLGKNADKERNQSMQRFQKKILRVKLDPQLENNENRISISEYSKIIKRKSKNMKYRNRKSMRHGVSSSDTSSVSPQKSIYKIDWIKKDYNFELTLNGEVKSITVPCNDVSDIITRFFPTLK